MQMQTQIISHSNSTFLSLNHNKNLTNFLSLNPNSVPFRLIQSTSNKMNSLSLNSSSNNINIPILQTNGVQFDDRFTEVANLLADASGDVIRKYFRTKFDIVDKEDLSPVTIADREAEECMVKIIQSHFPCHAIFGEENGWMCKQESADFVWVLDPIDGTKSFITGKPVFGTLIALLYKGNPILGVIDQPILRERWIGVCGRTTVLNGQEISTRNCSQIAKAYMYTTSPHLFGEDTEVAFARVRNKVKVPLYGCDCYAYALLSSGYVDLVIETGLKPYDFFALIPVIEGAGGVITDWNGHQLHWEASSSSHAPTFSVLAAGDKRIHQEALETLQWT